jgi:hypothetical protein
VKVIQQGQNILFHELVGDRTAGIRAPALSAAIHCNDCELMRHEDGNQLPEIARIEKAAMKKQYGAATSWPIAAPTGIPDAAAVDFGVLVEGPGRQQRGRRNGRVGVCGGGGRCGH